MNGFLVGLASTVVAHMLWVLICEGVSLERLQQVGEKKHYPGIIWPP
jgi:hypothetical protein